MSGASYPTGRSARRRAAGLYGPLDYLALRAPVLPVDAFLRLGESAEASTAWEFLREPSAGPHADDALARNAIAIGSLSLLDALEPDRLRDAKKRKADSRLLRYLIRLSTRPTPFGLFAGVALGSWSDATDAALSPASNRPRLRPDMSWLMNLVMRIEADPDIRRHLNFIANPMALDRAGRIFLVERLPDGSTAPLQAISIKATGAVRRTLAAARDYAPYARLASNLLTSTSGATDEKVEALLTELWRHTLLLSDLRPPLTTESPARCLLDRLAGIPAAAEFHGCLSALLEGAAKWDIAPPAAVISQYRRLAGKADEMAPCDRSPFQVDLALGVAGSGFHRDIAQEAARAAELLVRMSPMPRGPAYMDEYRRAFERRYGRYREAPLIELLDPNFGLGAPAAYGQAAGAAAAQSAPDRNAALMDMAATAMRNRTLQMDLPEPLLRRLETVGPSVRAPISLDLQVSVAAHSRSHIDRGDFQVIVGPNVGGAAAGRTLGRFADILSGAEDALLRTAAAESIHAPQAIWAELVYQPRVFRLANVAVRPNVRSHQILIGVGPGDRDATAIPPGELTVGLRDNRFYLRWPRDGRQVIVTAGHMLNDLRAPALCRFLSDVSRDGQCRLAAFNWGPAWQFPFLPRVQSDRVVLALARWRVTRGLAERLSAGDPLAFRDSLAAWRREWGVPRYVYLASGDNRLLLDLLRPAQIEELRLAIAQVQGSAAVLLTEALPGPDHAWLTDGEGRRFLSDLVVPLVLRQDVASRGLSAGAVPTAYMPPAQPAYTPATHLRPPGSDWLFAKLYCPNAVENDLILGPVSDVIERALSSGSADACFFLRYNDPDRHIRLRFHGRPDRLLSEVLPLVSVEAARLIEVGLCSRFALDTYEREVERFGGLVGMAAAERLFAADSRAAIDILRSLQGRAAPFDTTTLATVSVDALLGGLGLDGQAKVNWCRRHAPDRRATGVEYRRRKDTLRDLLGRVDGVSGAFPLIADALARLARSAAVVSDALRAAEARGELTREATAIFAAFVHLHVNRLWAADMSMELRVLGLVQRTHEGLLRSRAARSSAPPATKETP